MALIDNFNSYSDGDLNGQGSWSGSTLFDVEGTTVQEGTKAVSNVSATGGEIAKGFTIQANGVQRFYIRQVDGTLADNSGTFQLKEGATVIVQLFRWSTSNGSDLRYQTGASTYTNFGTLTSGNWFYVDIEWRSSDKYIRYSFNGGAFTSWVAPVNNFTSGIDTVVLQRYNAGTGETNFDNFTDQTPATANTSNFFPFI